MRSRSIALRVSFAIALAACGTEGSRTPPEAPAPAEPPSPLAATPPTSPSAPAADPISPPSAATATARVPPSVNPCTFSPALGSPIADLVRASDGMIWTVDREHSVRRYALAAGPGCALTLDATSDGVLPAFAGRPNHEAGHLVADAAGHVYVSTETTSERWTGAHRDYECDHRVWVVAPAGDRGFVAGRSTLAMSDTGCVASEWAAPDGYARVVPLAVLASGDIVATGFSDTERSDEAGNTVAIVVPTTGAARGVLYDGANVPEHPALAAFACGAAVCMHAMGSVLVLEPGSMTFSTPIAVGALAGADDEAAAESVLAPLGDGDAVYAFRAWNEIAGADEPRVVRLHGLPH